MAVQATLGRGPENPYEKTPCRPLRLPVYLGATTLRVTAALEEKGGQAINRARALRRNIYAALRAAVRAGYAARIPRRALIEAMRKNAYRDTPARQVRELVRAGLLWSSGDAIIFPDYARAGNPTAAEIRRVADDRRALGAARSRRYRARRTSGCLFSEPKSVRKTEESETVTLANLRVTRPTPISAPPPDLPVRFSELQLLDPPGSSELRTVALKSAPEETNPYFALFDGLRKKHGKEAERRLGEAEAEKSLRAALPTAKVSRPYRAETADNRVNAPFRRLVGPVGAPNFALVELAERYGFEPRYPLGFTPSEAELVAAEEALKAARRRNPRVSPGPYLYGALRGARGLVRPSPGGV